MTSVAARTGRSALAPLALALVLGLLGGAQAQTESEAGLVFAAQGGVSGQLGQVRRMLLPNDPVFVGDRVATEATARANLKLGETTTLKLGGGARITIDRFISKAGGTITLGSGALLLDKDPAPGNRPVEIRSAYGLIAVRGTQVFAGPSNGVFGVFVQRGRVTVRAGGRAVTLRAGQGTDIASPGARPTAAKTWGAPRVAAALAAVE